MADDPTDQTTPYDASMITVLEGLEAVRRHPGMYVGPTDERGLRHLVYIVVDGAVDEALAGCARNVHVTVLADGGVRVTDDGCGLPVDVVEPVGTPAVEFMLTGLFCAGLFCGPGPRLHYGADTWTMRHGPGEWTMWHEPREAYHVQWLFAIGLAVVNALSERLVVAVRRQGHVWRQSYRGVPDAPLSRGETTTATGTTITFWADPEIFATTVYDADVLRSRFRQLTFLTKGLHLTFTDERDGSGTSVTFSGGLTDYVACLNQVAKAEPIHSEIIVFEDEDTEQRIRAEVAMQWTGSDDESLHTFVNTILTSYGGTHAEGFREAVTALVAQYAKDAGLRSDEDDLGDGEICRGLTAVVNVIMADPQFSGPTREYLANAGVKTFVQKVVVERFGEWLACHPDQAETITRHVSGG